jgi:hypothetical protein
VKPPANPITLPKPARGAVRFEQVGFRYPSRPDYRALHNVSFAVNPGEAVALVGPRARANRPCSSCCCASSIRKRAHPVRRRDHGRSDPRDLRANIALVAQDPAIFSGSIFDNIRYGRPDASPDEVQRAPKRPPPMNSSADSRRLRGQARRARRDALRRPAPAHRDRARDPAQRAAACCSTKRRARSMPRTSGWCSRVSPI